MSVIGNQWQCARWSKLSSAILVLIFRVNRVSVYIDLRINPAESSIGASYCWTQHPETMKDNELIRSAPPIPPRRIKRKTKPFLDPTACSSSSATTPVFLSERRVRLPPPPPPPRGSLLRGIRDTLTRSGSPGNGEKQRIAEAEARQQLSTFGSALCLPLARGNSPKKVLASQGSPRRRTKDKAKVSRPNEYPPLFFTIQDFQEVMADVEGSYNRTLRNMTTFEPTPRPRDISFGGSSDGGSLQEDQVLFRVTTTSVPFERCRGSTWGETGNDPNHFIFEDYVDRRQIRKPPATRLILFGDDTFDHDEEDEERSTSTCSRTPSRVRFLIDSPDEIDAGKVTEFDSLHNVESLPPDDVAPISESDLVKDEFGDVPFDSILSVGPSEDSTNSSNTDFQTILVRADVEKVPAESASRDREDETPRRRTDESAPENIGRSSFLMDMLREREDSKEWSACKVVATHPKGLIPGCRIDGDEVRASVAIEAKSRLLGELSSSFSGIRLKQRAEARLGSNDEGDKERAGSLKIDLKEEEEEEEEKEDADGRSSVTSNCNLDSVIDSKVVKCNVREQEPIEEESRVVIPRSEPRNSSNYDCSQKTDQPIDIKYVDNITVREGDKKQAAEEEVVQSAEVANEERKNMAEEYKDNDDDGSSDVTNNNNGNKVELAPRISVDKCAIVLKCNNNINNNNNNININNNNNNNNDNNAMTPVDLSTDQSKKVLSIIPGSVRSFVKFYEIQGETSIGFNVSENYKDASDYVLPKITVEEFGKTTEIESSGENTSSENLVETPVKPIQIEIENDVKYTIVTRKQMRKDQYNGPAQRDQKPTNVNQPVENVFDKSNKPISVETATPRQTGLPLVKLCEIDEERGEKSGTRSSEYSEKPAERVAQETRNVAPRISPENQGSPTSRETTNLTSSGTTTQSVPKSSATTINERYTFYCTV